MTKIISISVWGTDRRYLEGAVKNILMAENFFSDWFIFLYVSTESYFYFKDLNNKRVKIVKIDVDPLNGSFWRFYPFFEEDGYVLSRDADSRLSLRESQAVDEWVRSGKTYTIIRDHPRHFDFPMLAGMWGAITPLNENLREKMMNYSGRHNYLIDQEYLTKEIWPIASNDCLIHSMNENSWFSSCRSTIDFIGQGYDENDKPLY